LFDVDGVLKFAFYVLYLSFKYIWNSNIDYKSIDPSRTCNIVSTLCVCVCVCV